MAGYSIPTPITGEVNLEGFGAVAFSFDAGVATAKNDAEAAALAWLVQNDLVTVAPEKKAAAPKSETSSKE